ncbi:MAG: hypothetical protein ABEH43_00805 [Flavobacteriales bacterium]
MKENTETQNLDLEQFKTDDFFNESFKFWFSDHEKVRSPFPDYIRKELRTLFRDKFLEWLDNLDPEILKEQELNEETIVQKFEQILFETAMEKVYTEDERLTLMYPFMPRTGDPIEEKHNRESTDQKPPKSKIVARSIHKKNDTKWLYVKCQREDGSEWSTSFELPA